MAYSRPGETRKKVLRLVRERILSGSPPTVREIQESLGFRSVQTARGHLDILVQQGLLSKEPRKSRGYRLPGSSGPLSMMVPILGRVQAGALTDAVEDLEGYITVQSRFPRSQLFALRTKGESMIDAGILPKDILIVRKQPVADPGDIVVAMVDGEATVKILKVVEGRVELHPANPAFHPIVPTEETFSILGKVVEVRRYFESPSSLISVDS
jgi:repressor LexA